MKTEGRRILVHGHRGARARPENTIPAFQYAIEHGADVLELDVAVTKDDVPVVSHYPVPNQTICSGPAAGRPIRSLTLAELDRYDCGTKRNPLFATQVPAPGAKIPTLDAVFALGGGNAVQFNIEIKIFGERPDLTPGPELFTRLIYDLIRNHKLERRAIVQSFDPRTLRAMKRLDPSIPRGALFETERDWDGVAREFEATILSPEYRLVSRERVSKAHAAGQRVIPWTVNRPNDWAKLADAGVDAIISDDPERLIRWLEERGLR